MAHSKLITACAIAVLASLLAFQYLSRDGGSETGTKATHDIAVLDNNKKITEEKSVTTTEYQSFSKASSPVRSSADSPTKREPSSNHEDASQVSEEFLRQEDFVQMQQTIIDILHQASQGLENQQHELASITVAELGIDPYYTELMELDGKDQVVALNGIEIDELVTKSIGGSVVSGATVQVTVVQNQALREITISQY